MNTTEPFGARHCRLAQGWIRSTHCNPDGGNCLEIARRRRGRIAVRKSGPDTVPTLDFGSRAWAEMISFVRDEH